jgi:HAP1 N-terminal conserved region
MNIAFIVFFQKERDLELAARIGQQLLRDKCSLQKRNDRLEEQLLQANEKVHLQRVLRVFKIEWLC